MEKKTFELSSSMRFLIIDDNESYRNLILIALKKLGFRDIQMSISSTLGIKMLKSAKIDLIICDRNLPVLDGAQILKEIRDSFEIRGTPFLMMGAGTKVTREDLVLLAEYEIDGYLTKPFTYKTLMEKITSSLEHYENPNNLEYNISLAKRELINKKFELALAMFEKLLEKNPNSARIRICIARCHREMKNYNKAIDYCREAITKNPLYAQSYDELGKAFLDQDKVEDAMVCFKNAIAISPLYPIRYEDITDILIEKSFHEQAEFVLNKAHENNVDLENFNFKYGEVLYSLRKLEAAIIYLEKALYESPDNKALLNLMGICLKDLGRGDDALKHYNLALKRYPTDTKLLFNKALCLINLKREDQAKKILQSLLLIEPKNKKIANKLEEITSKQPL